MKTFGEKIKEIRKSRNMSQEEFAKLLGTSKQVISRYETNQRIPKISVAQKYAKILGFSLTNLANDEFNPFYKDPSEMVYCQDLRIEINEKMEYLNSKRLEKILKLASDLFDDQMVEEMDKRSNDTEKE